MFGTQKKWVSTVFVACVCGGVVKFFLLPLCTDVGGFKILYSQAPHVNTAITTFHTTMFQRLCTWFTSHRSLRSWLLQDLEKQGQRYFCMMQADVVSVVTARNKDIHVKIKNVKGPSLRLDGTPAKLIFPHNMMGMPCVANDLITDQTITVEVNPMTWHVNRVHAVHWLLDQHHGYLRACCERTNGYDIYLVSAPGVSPLDPLFVPATIKGFDKFKTILNKYARYHHIQTRICANVMLRKNTFQVESLSLKYVSTQDVVHNAVKARFQSMYNPKPLQEGAWVHMGDTFLHKLHQETPPHPQSSQHSDISSSSKSVPSSPLNPTL